MTTTFVNCRLCYHGTLVPNATLTLSHSTGLIVPGPSEASSSDETIDLHNAILAPGFIELQTNGLRGFHFTHFDTPDQYATNLDSIARYLPTTGVTAFYATLPTIPAPHYQLILPHLRPRQFPSGAALLGAHAEGPYLHPSKKGAHNSSLFHLPTDSPPTSVYGPAAFAPTLPTDPTDPTNTTNPTNLTNTNQLAPPSSSSSPSSPLKLVTLAPDLPGTEPLIANLTAHGIRVALGHSAATYPQGLAALRAGATALTHTLNAMTPLHHRDPGLAGLITLTADADATATTADDAPSPPRIPPIPSSPYFSLIPDGNHLHPSIATLLFRANPTRCLLITDSIELAGQPDGTYPGHAQIPFPQTKQGTRVVIAGTETLIGGCAGLDECVRNLVRWSGCGVAAAVRCVTENVVGMMGEGTRGVLEVGRRGDVVVLDDGGEVLQTWMGGRKVYGRREEGG